MAVYWQKTEPDAFIDTSCDSGTSTIETYYLKLIARQIYMRKSARSTRWINIGEPVDHKGAYNPYMQPTV